MIARETIYNGVLYRSRLEARWAIFFDVIGIPFHYEPKQFMTSEGFYLPDFYLPSLRMWVEIKPATQHGPTPEEILKMRDVADTEGRVGFIFCGFPDSKNGWINYVIFVPGMRPVSDSMTWRHSIEGIDLDLLVPVALVTVASRESRLHEISMEDAMLRLLLGFGVIDRYRHNRAMQENIAVKRKEAAENSRVSQFMAPLRDFISDVAESINSYSERLKKEAA